MKLTRQILLVVVFSALAICLSSHLNFWAWVDAQGIRIRPGSNTPATKKTTPRPSSKSTVKPTPSPTPKTLSTPTPVSLPEIASSPRPRLVGFFRWEGTWFFPNPLLIDETKVPKPPPPLIEAFNFKTLTMDRRENPTQESVKSARFYREYINDNVWLELVEIPAGEFMMGTSKGETNKDQETQMERPAHKVSVPKFWMGKFEVTQEQWRAVAELPKVKINLEDQSAFKGDKNLPAERITWDEAVEFCARLAAATGREYRLPTEAEWEYAARAGTTTAFAFGETINTGIVNYDGSQPFWTSQIKTEGRRKTVAVGSLGKANAFGLFDMHGNVVEWCQDRWHPNYDGAPRDGSAWMSGNAGPVVRGGSYEDAAPDCRSARRVSYGTGQVRRKDQGFRIAVGKPF